MTETEVSVTLVLAGLPNAARMALATDRQSADSSHLRRPYCGMNPAHKWHTELSQNAESDRKHSLALPTSPFVAHERKRARRKMVSPFVRLVCVISSVGDDGPVDGLPPQPE